MGNLAHSTADDEVLENSENKLLPGCRGVSKRSGTAGQEPPVRGGEQLVAVAVLKGNRFMQLVAHYETLQGVRLTSISAKQIKLHLCKFIATLGDAAEVVMVVRELRLD